ncbi:MAG: hypothetical protein WC762_07610 [Methylobacter sp.]
MFHPCPPNGGHGFCRFPFSYKLSMPLSFVRTLLVAIVASGLLFHPCNAAQLTLNINVDIEGRQFLITNQQKVAIALASPLSESNTAIVVAFVIEPSADSTRIVFDSDAILYVSYSPVAAFDIIKIAYPAPTPVVYGQAYNFNGVAIVGGDTRAGLDGYVTIYFDAPQSSTLPVETGLAWYIHEKDTSSPTLPLPINYYTLYPYETRVIPKPDPVVWVFIASNDISAGSVLPVSIMKPLSNSVQAFNVGTDSVKQAAVPQIGDYLSVDLDAPEQATIHFELTKNAFVYGP